MTPLAFATPAQWHDRLAANHASANEVWALYHKKASGVAVIDWQQAVEAALVWGWIDSIRKTRSEIEWIHRCTPRKADSSWSRINRSHAERLTTARHPETRAKRIAAFIARLGRGEPIV